MMLDGLIAIAAIVCAAQAVRAARLLSAAVWLAGASAFTALWLYRLGAMQLAVVELAVGAGLVTVLFVFAISISGEDAFAGRPRVPRLLALGLVAVALALLGLPLLPGFGSARTALGGGASATVMNVFWNDRALDTLAQIVLIFAGVLGVLNLVGREEPIRTEPVPDHAAAELPVGAVQDLETRERVMV